MVLPLRLIGSPKTALMLAFPPTRSASFSRNASWGPLAARSA